MKQTAALFSMGLKLFATRPGPGLIIILGMAGLTAVVVSLFVIAGAFEATLTGTGKSDRALILRAGSTSEINGNVPLQQYSIVRDMPEVRKGGGVGLASRETYVTVKVPRRSDGMDATLPMRGVIDASFDVRPEVAMVAGERFTPGKYELVAGLQAARIFAGLDVGSTLWIRGQQWQVTGHFSAGSGSYASEVWVDERLLAELLGRGQTFSSMLVQLESPDHLEALQARIAGDRQLTLAAHRESTYYSDLGAATTGLIKGLGWVVGVIMALGAVVAALNTMQSALQTRAREVATLRALGFERLAIFAAVLLECVTLSLLGAGCALVVLYLGLQGETLSTVAATTTSSAQVAFQFDLSNQSIALAVLLALSLGILGGLFPGLQIVRSGLVRALRN